jgi:hypothetical protein
MKSRIGKGLLMYFKPEKKRQEMQCNDEDHETRYFMLHNLNRLWFSYDLAEKSAPEITDYLDMNLRVYKRDGGIDFQDWFSVLRENIPISFTHRQRDAFYSWVEENEDFSNRSLNRKPRGEISTISYFIDVLSQTTFCPNNEEDYKTYVLKICNKYDLKYSKRVENSKNERAYSTYSERVLSLAKCKLNQQELIEFTSKLNQNIREHK